MIDNIINKHLTAIDILDNIEYINRMIKSYNKSLKASKAAKNRETTEWYTFRLKIAMRAKRIYSIKYINYVDNFKF